MQAAFVAGEETPRPPLEVQRFAKEAGMTLQARRVITGHDANGRAIVTINEVCKNVTSDAKSVEAGGKVLPAVG